MIDHPIFFEIYLRQPAQRMINNKLARSNHNYQLSFPDSQLINNLRPSKS